MNELHILLHNPPLIENGVLFKTAAAENAETVLSEFGGVRRVLSAFFDAEIDVFKGYRGKIFAIAINRFVNFVVIGNFVIPYGRFFGFAVDAFGGRAVDAAAAGKDTAVFVFGV